MPDESGIGAEAAAGEGAAAGGVADKLAAAREAAKAAGTHLVDDWREAIGEPEIAGHASLASIKDLKSLTKSYVNAQKLIGADKIPKPSDKWTDKEWGDFFKAIGRPEDAGKYDLRAEGLQIPEGFRTPEEFATGFKKAVHEAGLTPKQANKVWTYLQSKGVEAFNGYQKETTGRISAQTEELRKEWGQAYDDKMKEIQGLAVALDKKLPGLADWFRSSGVGREPMIHRLLSVLHSELGSEGKIGTDFQRISMTPLEAKSAHDSIMGDKTNPDYEAYWKGRHPRHEEVMKKVEKLRAIMPA
jgi:hypothetical protein